MNYEEYLLTHLIEECSEVIKAATKCQRFGKNHFWEKEGVMNKEALAIELGDVNFLVDKLRAIGWRFDSSKYDASQRFHKALQLSVDTGHVVLHEAYETTDFKVGLEGRMGSTQNPKATPIPANGSQSCLEPSSYPSDESSRASGAPPSCEGCDD